MISDGDTLTYPHTGWAGTGGVWGSGNPRGIKTGSHRANRSLSGKKTLEMMAFQSKGASCTKAQWWERAGSEFGKAEL